MAGRAIALDAMWAREQPGHCGKEGSAAAVQVLVARGDCVGALRSPGVCCRKCQSHSLKLLPAPPCSPDSPSQTSLEANAVSTEIRDRGRERERQNNSYGVNRERDSGSTYSRWYTSALFIHREPCWVEIELDALALESTNLCAAKYFRKL